jgi:hypothetical protein
MPAREIAPSSYCEAAAALGQLRVNAWYERVCQQVKPSQAKPDIVFGKAEGLLRQPSLRLPTNPTEGA